MCNLYLTLIFLSNFSVMHLMPLVWRGIVAGECYLVTSISLKNYLITLLLKSKKRNNCSSWPPASPIVVMATSLKVKTLLTVWLSILDLLKPLIAGKKCLMWTNSSVPPGASILSSLLTTASMWEFHQSGCYCAVQEFIKSIVHPWIPKFSDLFAFHLLVPKNKLVFEDSFMLPKYMTRGVY